MHNNHSNIYNGMLAPVAAMADPSRQQRAGIRDDRHGQFTGQELVYSVCVRVLL